MNKKHIFAFFILIALLLTCAGVSFASGDLDDSHISDEFSEDNLDDFIIDDGEDDSYGDDEDSYDDSDEDEDWDDYSDDEDDWDEDSDDYSDEDEDWDDYSDDEDDWDDEDWDDYSDDEDDWDDEDWDDYSDDEDDWDDEDWEDYDDDIDWIEEGNYTKNGELYYYGVIAYKSGKTVRYAFAASNSQDSPFFGRGPADSNSSDNHSETELPAAGENYNEMINSTDQIASNNTANISNTLNETALITGNGTELGFLAMFALLIISFAVLI